MRWLVFLILIACGGQGVNNHPIQYGLLPENEEIRSALIRARDRMEAAVGESYIDVFDVDSKIGIKVSFTKIVSCPKEDVRHAACTKRKDDEYLGVWVRDDISGEFLIDVLTHELIHVMSSSRAQHTNEGVFMSDVQNGAKLYITDGVLVELCQYFVCTKFNPER